MAQISWYGRRRSRHWSIRNAAKMKLRTDDESGRTTFGSMSAGCLLMDGDETKEQSIEKCGRAVVDRGQAIRIEGAAAGDHPQLGQERPPRRDEQGDRLGEGDATGGQATGQVVGRSDRGPFGVVAGRVVGGVEVRQQRADERAATVAERLAVRCG